MFRAPPYKPKPTTRYVDPQTMEVVEKYEPEPEGPKDPKQFADELFSMWQGTNPLATTEEGFKVGFEKGHETGFAAGFNKGAKQGVEGLIGVQDRGERARKLAVGNMLQKPSTKLEAMNADQLTAEVCNILAQYAILPVEVRVGSVLDALRALPGVDIPKGQYDSRFDGTPNTGEKDGK